ncbi:alpha-N-arabinofuranosidase [Paenibacillus sp. 1_12]|uniref:alpha-L-arabinofuranosidase C-terminal domain-containing protein n=1 Tax=Paenibacillus sp. 1_12 TaxID=1566278 RepID=UPI0008E91003|nr:alpha-L-arabinofuranosidase C-terminal domain-containing protein [Paenibacillus sp. 1_12]SFK98845.1 alpha-N-arabinofuranosidase [Paenibacillus sp. 1_12]
MSRQATIQVNSKSVQPHSINPFIFAHFLEDIRDHMDAMLAYPLKNMDFEEHALMNNGISGCWQPFTNGKNTLYTLEPAASGHSGHSQRIRILSDDDCDAGLSQAVSLKGGISYHVKLYARASLDIHYVRIEIVDKTTGNIISENRIELTSHNWLEYECQLQVTGPDCPQAEFRLYVPQEHERWMDHVSTGMLWLDHISILPENAVGNVKPEVVELTQRLNAGMMRIAGNYISAYHWKDAVGPMYNRPNMINEAWGGWTSKYFGTDEFIRFCRELNVEPLICVNAGSGTPKEAAEWVEYCNGDANTPMGAMRAANGNLNPYNVKYWEIGNELYGPWQVGTCTAEEFGYRYLDFCKAMKGVDPSILLMGNGDDNLKWNQTVLDIAGAHMDYLTIHIYHGLGRFGMDRSTPKEERFAAMVSFPEVSRSIIEETEALLTGHPEYGHVKLTITEYNTMYFPNTNRKGLPNEHTLEAAVANAANLNEFIRKSHIVEMAHFSDLVNGWLGGCIRVGDHYADQTKGKLAGWSGKALSVYGTPTYYVMELYANSDIHCIVDHALVCDTFHVTGGSGKLSLNNLPVLDVVSCSNKSGSTLTIFVTNRSLNPVSLKLDITGLNTETTASVKFITGDDIDWINTVNDQENIICQREGWDWQTTEGSYDLRPHTVYAFEFRDPEHS